MAMLRQPAPPPLLRVAPCAPTLPSTALRLCRHLRTRHTSTRVNAGGIICAHAHTQPAAQHGDDDPEAAPHRGQQGAAEHDRAQHQRGKHRSGISHHRHKRPHHGHPPPPPRCAHPTPAHAHACHGHAHISPAVALRAIPRGIDAGPPTSNTRAPPRHGSPMAS